MERFVWLIPITNEARTQDSTSLSSFRGIGSSASTQSERIAAMKQAFGAQFKANFVSASLEGVPPQICEGVEDPEANRKRKKSRWE